MNNTSSWHWFILIDVFRPLIVTNPQGLKRFFLFLVSLMSCLPFLGQTIQYENASISDGEELTTISEITLDFNFDAVSTSLGIPAADLGISSVMKDFFKYRMLLYKGSKDSEGIGQNQDPSTNEDIVGYGYITIGKSSVVNGQHSITIPFTNPITMTPGEVYTIYIPGKMFQAGYNGTLYSNTKYPDSIIIEIKGSNSVDNNLQLTTIQPEVNTEIDILSELLLEFSQNISIADNTKVDIATGGGIVASTTNLYCEGNMLKITFDNISLYKGKDYVVTIPSNAIMTEDGLQPLDAISLQYDLN